MADPAAIETTCKLCLAGGCVDAGKNKQRTFLHCPSCGLAFVPSRFWTTLTEERARYGHHDNRESNPGYVRFLGEVADVVMDLARPGARARILDFGAGENAVLTRLVQQRGFDCTAYDPLYDLGKTALAGRYDVVVLCEVIEHLRDLRGEIIAVGRCIEPGGCMVARTQCYPSVAEIPAWWYARDPTHLQFFAPKTLAFAAGLCGLGCEPTERPDITIWRRR